MQDGDAPASRADHEYMARLADGSQAAWGKLYDRHYPALRRFCGNFTSSPEIAEEWAQEAFLRIREKAHTFHPGADLKPWLYKLARNICLENLRKHQEVHWSDSVFVSGVRALADSDPSPATRAANIELSEKARQILDSLSEDQRTVFLLKYVEGLSRQEIAEAMDIPEGTVKSRLYYAMIALQKEMDGKL